MTLNCLGPGNLNIYSIFHLTKTLWNVVQMEANGRETSWECFWKIWKLSSILQNVHHSTENSGKCRSKMDWNRNFWEESFENVGTPCYAALFFRNFGNISHSSAVNQKMLFHLPLEIFNRFESVPGSSAA